MHLSIILISIGLAIWIRSNWQPSQGSWAKRWQQAFTALLMPPLMLLCTSLTIVGMGHHGTMLSLPVGWLGCHLALGFLAFAAIALMVLVLQGWRSLTQIRTFPLTNVAGCNGRILDTSELLAAQIGFWQPELVVSRGLLQTLQPDQLAAVLAHEQAHLHYRDTFWFFWLGWLRQLTHWLPKTEALWQELLLLRELRADHRAAQQVDALVLAESLLQVVRKTSQMRSPWSSSHPACAAFEDRTAHCRLEERIEFLLTQPDFPEQAQWQVGISFLLTLLPVFTILLHRFC